MTTVCKGCGKPIRWIRTNGGKKMPVDAEEILFKADRNGTEIFVRKDGSVAVGRRSNFREDRAEIGYTSHFATCPHGDAFRKKDKAGKEAGNQQQISMLL